MGAAALAALRAAAPGLRVETDADALAPHLTDWRGHKTGRAAALLLPRSTAEVQAIVRAAAAHRVAIVPQGGNTGLVGGSVPEADGGAWLLSLRLMDRIDAPDAAGLTLRCGAGAVLERVRAAADAAGCAFPLSLGAKGSATIGGLIASNAGGVEVLRHGPMRQQVLGLRAVLPDGSLLDQMAGLRKDNTGYDVKQLLIGSEGTLGVVTAAVLRLVPRPAARAVAWAGAPSLHAALRLLARAREASGDTVESFEVMPAAALELVLRVFPDRRAPLAGAHAWHCLIEMAGASREGAAAAMEAALGGAMAAGDAGDAVIASSDAQAAALWRLREEVPLAERADGPAVKNDVTLPVAALPAWFDAAAARLTAAFPGVRPFAFGHLGDGNLHMNLRAPEGADAAAWLAAHSEAARRLLHDLVAEAGGSISAEHGIGTLKAAELRRLGDPGKLAAMRAIKAALDPLGIMNPGKLFA